MKRFITYAFALAATIAFAATAWSQAAQSGGAGTASGAGTSAGAGTAGGAAPAGPVTTPGAAGTTGTAGTPGATGTIGAGSPGNQAAAAAAGRANVGVNPYSGGAGFNVYGNVNRTPFFSDPGVRQQLNMNDNQFNMLNRSYQDAYGRYNRGMSNINTLTEQQRAALTQKLESQFNNEFGQTVGSTFTDPQVRRRYDQLNRQYMGYNAFNDTAIQRQLNLTPQQLQQVRRLAVEWRQQLAQMARTNGTNGNLRNIDPQQWSQIYAQYWTQLNSVLTPEQQQTWSQLVGKQYTFSPYLYYPDQSGSNPINGANDNPSKIVPQGTNANVGTGATTR